MAVEILLDELGTRCPTLALGKGGGLPSATSEGQSGPIPHGRCHHLRQTAGAMVVQPQSIRPAYGQHTTQGKLSGLPLRLGWDVSGQPGVVALVGGNYPRSLGATWCPLRRKFSFIAPSAGVAADDLHTLSTSVAPRRVVSCAASVPIDGQDRRKSCFVARYVIRF